LLHVPSQTIMWKTLLLNCGVVDMNYFIIKKPNFVWNFNIFLWKIM